MAKDTEPTHDIPEYFPEMLSARKKYALEIIDLLDDFVTDEFKDA